jgi:2-oxoglutarate ferredoxin oxidoreductase subunit gamma
VTERVIMAGFGGQGMMLIGKVYAAAAMRQGREVTFFPSYGAEVRGGTAHCQVTVSDAPIYSPMVDAADTLIAMNGPSYDKFRPRLKPGGLLLLNTSMVDLDAPHGDRDDLTVLQAPTTEMANELGNVRVANTIMLGAYAVLRPLLPAEAVLEALEASLGRAKAHLVEVNRAAFRRGVALAAQAAPA